MQQGPDSLTRERVSGIACASGGRPTPGWAAERAALAGEDGQDLGGEALELLELILTHEANAEIGDAGARVALERRDHRLGWTEAHGAAHVHPTAVVSGQEFPCAALGGAHVVLESNGGVDAEGKARQASAVPRERLVGPLADAPAVLGFDVGGDDAVSESRESVELRGEHLAAIGGGDQH